ncbi:WG repeat-containing protein [Paenibacillus sp. DMB5]|uniref:WG repeat-containing protein n=1 Tax=Paenibacillus sp. DMB5 TaxID=1780103 RepID=UPI00076DBEF9|nr:WG repeat-containing protein [Paenibacillus sp. DMB5]KUP22078.1 hypothetical protein AWJ19_21455 [Paenibacillus sp. DMB5]
MKKTLLIIMVLCFFFLEKSTYAANEKQVLRINAGTDGYVTITNVISDKEVTWTDKIDKEITATAPTVITFKAKNSLTTHITYYQDEKNREQIEVTNNTVTLSKPGEYDILTSFSKGDQSVQEVHFLLYVNEEKGNDEKELNNVNEGSDSPVSKNYKNINFAIEPIYFGSGSYGEDYRQGRVYTFSEGLAWVTVDKLGTAVVINQNGDQVIGPKYKMPTDLYDYAYQFSEGLSRVLSNGQWIYIDSKGKEIITTNYDLVYNFQDGFAAVKKDGKWGFIDKTGQEVIKLQYDELDNGHYLFDDGTGGFYEERAAVAKGGKWGVIDKAGKVILPFKYSNINNYKDGITIAYYNNVEGAYFDRDGKQLTKLTRLIGWPFNEGLAAYDDSSFKDKTGKTVINMSNMANYSPSGVFFEGMVVISGVMNGVIGEGFMNKQGKVVIKPVYEEALDFSEGLAMVRMKDKILYINKNGKTILSFNASDVKSAGSFKDGLAELEVVVEGDGESHLMKGFISNPLIIKVTVDGVKLALVQPPVIINGSAQVPLNAIFSSLKVNVLFDKNTQTITATRGSTVIKMTIGKDIAYVNGKAVKLATKVQTINNTTMVPLRFVSEALGANVQLDTITNTISILSGNK